MFCWSGADPEETSISLSGSPPPTSHMMSSDRVLKDTSSSTVYASTTASAVAAAASSNTVQASSSVSRCLHCNLCIGIYSAYIFMEFVHTVPSWVVFHIQ